MPARAALLFLASATLPLAAANAQQPADSAGMPTAAGTGTAGAGPDRAAIAARFRARLLEGDTDHDGRLSRAEWMAMRAAAPQRAAAGAGGAAGGGGMARDPGRTFDRLDTNRDGYLDSVEIDALIARRLARMDGDGPLARGGRRGRAGAGSGQDGSMPNGGQHD